MTLSWSGPESGKPMQERLTEAKLRVCITPHEQAERLQELRALSDGFVALTTTTAQRIGRAYHAARQASSATSADSALAAAILEIRPDGSLKLLSGGIAGGIKVLDTRDHAFFKISEEKHSIYGGSPVMADKPAKYELGALSFLHDRADAVHLTLPLASCVDVTERVGGKPRVYRVQAFSALPIDDSTLRTGSCDGNATSHVCEAMLGPLRDVADAMHLAPSPPCMPKRGVTVHSYERIVAPTRDPARVPDVGPAFETLLEEIGIGRHAADCGGECRAIEEAHGGVVLDPFRAVASRHHERSASEVGLPGPFAGATDGARLSQPLPFDVEGHMLPTGERCLADLHRLCIPEAVMVPKPGIRGSPSMLVIVRASGELEVKAAMVNTLQDLSVRGSAIAALGLDAGAAAAGVTVTHVAGTGCRVVSLRSTDDVVIVATPRDYWKNPGLTALFPATAGGVLARAGLPRVSPDPIRPAALPRTRVAATEYLLSEGNLAEAGVAVRAHVAEHAGEGSDDVDTLRAAVKAGLHSCGLGLRHVGRLWGVLAKGGGAVTFGRGTTDSAVLSAAVLECALVSACLPRHGSSAGLALEQLHRASAEGARAVVPPVASVIARACAAKGLSMALPELQALAERLRGCVSARPVARSWLRMQRMAKLSVKTAGLGGARESKEAHVSAGAAGDRAAETAKAGLLRELKHRQLCGEEHDVDVRGRLVQLGKRKLSSIAGAVAAALGMWRPSESDGGAGAMVNAGVWSTTADTLAAGARVPAGLEAYGRVLRIMQASLGPDHLLVGLTWGNIGDCRTQMGEHAPALEAYEQALRIQQASLGPDHPSVGSTWGSIGNCRREMGEYGSALEACEQGLQIQQASLGPDHPSVGSTWANIGACRTQMGELRSALEAYEQALPILQASLGPDHPSVGLTWGHIGACRREMGEYGSALEAFDRALRIMHASLGPDHPSAGTVWDGIGSCRLHMGEHRSALEAYEQALRILQASLGPDHSSVGRTWANIGVCRWEMGELRSGLEAHERALRIQQASLGPDHPDVGSRWGNIGTCRLRIGEYGSALEAFDRALRILHASLGPDHPFAGAVWDGIGSCRLHMGEHRSALEAFDRELRILQASLGPDHPDVGSTWGSIGACRREMGQLGSALEAFDRALRIQQASLGPDHLVVGRTWGSIGMCHVQMGDYRSALSVMVNALTIFRSRLGDGHLNTKMLYFGLQGIHFMARLTGIPLDDGHAQAGEL